MKLPGAILFIDDDDEDQMLFHEAVGVIHPAIKRLQASNGLEAIKLLQTGHHILPDLIFLDIRMPIMNGRECFLALKKLVCLQQVPIIICSNSKHAADQNEFDELGADFFLIKPHTLIDMINSILYVFAAYPSKIKPVHKIMKC